MTTDTMTPGLAGGAPGGEDRRFFGHPRGLQTLFFTEMWERFSYYGMRAFLMLFMTASVEAGGLGFSKVRAGMIFGLYTAMVYLLSVPGGWIADRFIGQQRAVMYGGLLIMSGHISLAVPGMATFYLGLALVAMGTGMLKPNISTIVGQLYPAGDKRRDGGFSIFYMGINTGALVAPLFCGEYLAESQSFKHTMKSLGLAPHHAWHFAFGAAAVGMGLGLLQYMAGRRYLGAAGLHPTPPKNQAEAARNRTILGAIAGVFIGLPLLIIGLAKAGVISPTPEDVGAAADIIMPLTAVLVLLGLYIFGTETAHEKRQMVVVIILFFAAAVFWGCFEQAGSVLTLFAKEHTDRHFLGWSFGVTRFQALNSAFVVIFAPVFAALWVYLAKRGKEPVTLMKFGLGMVGVGAGFLVLVPAANMVLGGSKVGWHWLAMLYLVHTWGELCLSPVGLSSMTKLAPPRITGLILGVWFLAASMGNYMAGRAVALTENMRIDNYFLLMAAFPAGVGVILFVLAKPVQRMLDRGAANAPASGH